MLIAAGSSCAAAASKPKIAIIIDDLGYDHARGKEVMALPGPVTCAIIPQTPWGPNLARAAIASGKEVMLHIPMETVGHRRLDKGGLVDTMSQKDFLGTVRAAIKRIPEAVGVNNHMGSALTAEKKPMDWLMDELLRDHLFFIDSRTTAKTVAESAAKQYGVPTAARDVFLDDTASIGDINKQFNELMQYARRHGSAIAIGHPHPATITYLQHVLPLMKKAGIELVPVSSLLTRPTTMAENSVSR